MFFYTILLLKLFFNCNCENATISVNTNNNQWIAKWSQPTTFTDNTILDPQRDIGGYRIYITPFGIDFTDNLVLPIHLADVSNKLILELDDSGNQIWTQEANINYFTKTSLDDIIRNIKADCSYWIAIRGFKPNNSGKINDSDFSNPIGLGPNFCADGE